MTLIITVDWYWVHHQFWFYSNIHTDKQTEIYINKQCWQLTLRKIAICLSKNCKKLDIFKRKIAKNFHFFQKSFLKKWKFLAFKKKKSQVFGNFLTVKWQFSGGSVSGRNIVMKTHIVSKIKLWKKYNMMYFVLVYEVLEKDKSVNSTYNVTPRFRHTDVGWFDLWPVDWVPRKRQRRIHMGRQLWGGVHVLGERGTTQQPMVLHSQGKSQLQSLL